MRVKVVRVLEYTFSSPEVAELQMTMFTVPAVGGKRFSKDVTIRSALVQYPEVDSDEACSDQNGQVEDDRQ